MLRPALFALAAASLVACGGDDTTTPDASGADVGRNDGGGGDVDPDVLPGTCDPTDCTVDDDGDGLDNCVDTAADPDGDGIAACDDDDSDGDGIPDSVEGADDSDDDGVPDFLDEDSDGDGINDEHEGTGDPDEDGIPNYLDDDSDGDGLSDTLEYGRRPGDGGVPFDRDGDGELDFLDLDTDGDGLGDADESGCPDATDHTRWDTDGDSVSDLIETTFGSDPCDPDSDLEGIVDFYFVLPYRGDRDSGLLDFGTELSQADIALNIDTTGSMSGQINALKTTLSSLIIPGVSDAIPNTGFSVSHFDDFPCGDYGGGNDRPFALLQRVTTDAAVAQAAVERIPLHGGGDTPESGVESLYQLATGLGTNDCLPNAVPPFDPLAGLVAGSADGLIGGVGFRRGSVPIAVHITDAPSHSRGGGYPYGASLPEMYEALDEIGARVIGVASSPGARTDLEQFATTTGAVVPVCAFDADRPASCGAGLCCTGANGTGVAPRGTDCPLVFDVAMNGSGLGNTIVVGIDALANFAPVDITVSLRPDRDEFGRSGIDTTCFIESVRPDVALPRPGGCASTPVPADFDGDGTNDGFTNVSPGSRVYFDVQAFNDCVPAAPVPQTFVMWIDVVAGGASVLDSRLVTVLVPPDLKD